MKFFDKNAVENICGCLTCVPDKVILIGNNEKKLKEHCERYHSFFLGRGKEIDFTYSGIRYKESKKEEIELDMLSNVADQLSAIVGEVIDKDICVIDLTGGQDLMLVGSSMTDTRIRISRCIVSTCATTNCITATATEKSSASNLLPYYLPESWSSCTAGRSFMKMGWQPCL